MAAAFSSTAATSSVAAASAPRPLGQLVPVPAQVVPGGSPYAITSTTPVRVAGGSTEVGGGPGGYYTKAQYREIVRYAASRYPEVVPEVDLPGHTNAALASYAELNCDGVAPPLYTGTMVGFCSLCVPKPVTYDFVDDVLREVAALTPGKYLHIGGDEAHATSHEDYVAFMAKAQAVVWSPAAARDWETYRVCLAAQGPRLTELGIGFYRSPQVDWGP
ncbi:family 20 glycosylhydrolase [Streptomyces sp. SID2119]|nr:family 20 glycosylhydrolase [Streptomyces sp. SID2119]